jgi:two-component system sensor kinase FixL
MKADAEPADLIVSELTPLADSGELAGALAHEVNDFLNVLHLQLAVLELKAPPDARNDLIEVRRQANQLGELVKHWQRSRSLPAQVRPIDLGRLLHGLDLEPSSVALRIEAAPDLPPIQGVWSDVRRLLAFAIENAISAALPGPGQVVVRIESCEGGVRLRVEDSGPCVQPEFLANVFDLSFAGRPGTDRLELAACRAIVRRMNGTISAENMPSGGFAVVVELPTV